MPFSLKNAGATYQRMATSMFHDIIHKEVEVHIDDMMVKSKTREGHPATKVPQKGLKNTVSGSILRNVYSE